MRWIDLTRSALHSVNHCKQFCAETSARANHPRAELSRGGVGAGCPIPSARGQRPQGWAALSSR